MTENDSINCFLCKRVVDFEFTKRWQSKPSDEWITHHVCTDCHTRVFGDTHETP